MSKVIHIAGPTISALDVVGKTLIATADVPLKRLAQDGAPTVYTVKKGQSVGVVYSWLDIKPGRSYLHWVFKDANGRDYYVEHRPGYFDGAAVETQIIEENPPEDQPFADKALDTITSIAKYGFGAWALFKIISSFANRSKA